MSSLGDVQQLYSNLQEIELFISKIQIKTETLRVESVHAVGEVRELEYVFYRVTGLMGRMGLPPEVDRAIHVLQRMILIARMLHTTIMMMEMSTPYGWILAAVTAGGLLISMQSIPQEIRGS
jgi:hypothetical protein